MKWSHTHERRNSLSYLTSHVRTAGLLLLAMSGATTHAEAETSSTGTQTILFVCPHNAAKSIMAASYFNEQARKRGLPAKAHSAGTHPGESVSTAVVALLREEGIDVSCQKPRRIEERDLAGTDVVISLGCDDLVSSVPAGMSFQSWEDVPPPISDLPGAQRSIKRHVEELVERLLAPAAQNPGGPSTPTEPMSRP